MYYVPGPRLNNGDIINEINNWGGRVTNQVCRKEGQKQHRGQSGQGTMEVRGFDEMVPDKSLSHSSPVFSSNVIPSLQRTTAMQTP